MTVNVIMNSYTEILTKYTIHIISQGIIHVLGILFSN